MILANVHVNRFLVVSENSAVRTWALFFIFCISPKIDIIHFLETTMYRIVFVKNENSLKNMFTIFVF